jgi:hypothetical protein
LTEERRADDEARAVALLQKPATIRARAEQLLTRARAGQSNCFEVCNASIEEAARLVARLSRERYPGRIPPHSRWRHFEVAGVDRIRLHLEPRLQAQPPDERWKARTDLCIVSVLLDAGAGGQWSYRETGGLLHQRSEGLALASLDGFCTGMFSHDPARPLQVSAQGLLALSPQSLGAMFQCRSDNALPGLEQRLQLLQSLGTLLEDRPEHFGNLGRPCGLLLEQVESGVAVQAEELLGLLLNRLGQIWPSPNRIGNAPLGDCWRHPQVEGEGLSRGWMPFHKLSQWLAYSLLEAMGRSGIAVVEGSALTGLPEYRNGGLMIDTGILVFKDAQAPQRSYTVDDPLVVEWRALTVALLEEVAAAVRLELGLDARALPLACVLEGGTWAAGRRLATQRRGGEAPINLRLTGTVF